VKQLIAEMQELKGEIPEDIRSLVARRIGRAIYHACPYRDQADAISQKFIAECKLEAGDPFAPGDLEVGRSELASFIDRWIHVQQFKRKDAEEFEPITSDMNEIRVSMCAELLELGNYNPADFGLV
jgi:hypothetical protein